MNINGQLEYKLRQLRLTGMLQTLSVRVKEAEESRAGYDEFLMKKWEMGQVFKLDITDYL